MFQPLRYKLPLLISALLAVAVGAFVWYANEQIHDLVEDAAGERLLDASARVAGLLGQSAVQPAPRLRAIAASRAVVTALATDGAPRSAELARLMAAEPSSDGRAFSRVLFGARCNRLAQGGPLAERVPCPRPGTAVVSELIVDGDSIAYAVSVPVEGAAGDTLGHIVEMRVISGQGVGDVEGLIGLGSRLLVGNHSGSVWTDLLRPVDGPGRSLAFGAVHHVTVAGGEHLAAAHRIPNTPWVILVHAPHRIIAAPARRLLEALLVGAGVVILVGALGAWRISRHVTAPLTELRAAAAGIAAGDYSRRAAVHRADEIGEVADMFNSMAVQVQAATDDLQAQALELEEQMDALVAAQQDSAAVRSLLDEVLACAPVGVAMVDRKVRFLKVNPALAALAGRPPEELMAQRPSMVVSGMGGLIEPLMRETMTTGRTIANRRLVSLEGAGAKRYWLVSIFPVRNADSSVDGAGLIVLDTTAQEELEERYLQAQKMEAVGRMAGGIAHDFNNLLTVILSYSAMALEVARDDADLQEGLEEIRAAAQRAASLTRQLLAFGRKQVLQPQLLSLNQIAGDMERMLQRVIGEDIALELLLAEELRTIHADPSQIEQVIMNLVVNARDAMPHGGHLAIETNNVRLSSELSAELGATAGEYVTLVVADTGAGMSWDVQRHLFEPFFTTKAPGRGTGLGLATVYGIVKQSGGDIHVSSAPGEGTRITIYFPVAQEEAEPSAPLPAREHVRGGSETILLLEDDPAVQTLGSRLLRRAGYHVLDARTPSQALEIARSHPGPIDLLLTDVVMPEMSGAAAVDAIRAVRPAIRTVFMSGYTDDEVVRRGVSRDSRRFLPKPFTPAELTRKVRDALDAIG